MDQGIAAVIAAGFGLIGAAVGGGAAIWGARVGARESTAAQARHEHTHWLRQERLEIFTQALSHLDLLADFLKNFDPHMHISGPPGPEQLAEEWSNVCSALDPIRETMNKVALVTDAQTETAPFAAMASVLEGVVRVGMLHSDFRELSSDGELSPELEERFLELWRISEEGTSKINEFRDAAARLIASPT
ncbi:hypothetical protein [Streptomyces antimycoticus]|uniref:hypothetical protein n=1 Tax=Streptomyces antimycoticus TaxID=68175 RepID=UPI003678BCA5